MSLSTVSDWFNPMLVRDLRQGLRSRSFTFIFLFIQGCLMFMVVLSLLEGSHGEAQVALGRLLQVGVMIFYYLVLPCFALYSLAPEFRDARMDLLQLTRLSARSLVAGKWFSLCAQALLVASTLVPYVALRYYFGGVDLAGELAGLGYTLAASLLLLGVGVALSCLNSHLIRLLAMAAWLYVLWPQINRWFGETSGVGWLGQSWRSFSTSSLMLLAAELPALWACLEFGASRLSPPGENHDTPRRWILPVLLAVAVAVASLGGNFFAHFYLFATGTTVVVLVLALCTEPPEYPVAYRPFVRWGFLGRLGGRFALYPGWPSAVVLTLLCSGLALALEWLLPALGYKVLAPQAQAGLHAFALFMPPAVLFPMVGAWILPVIRKLNPGLRYLNLILLCLVVLVFTMLMSNLTGDQTWTVTACLFPPNAWFLLGSDFFEPAFVSQARLLSFAGAVPTILVAVIGALWRMRKFSPLERSARDLPSPRRARRPALVVGPRKHQEPIL